jgi:uncharacterized protein
MSPSLPARGLLGLIQLYKWTLSPLIGRECRYLPTCSSYAADCVRAHGAWAGSSMAAARLCRCHPWGGSGWDPAPEAMRRNSWWRPWRYGDWKRGYRAPTDLSPPSPSRAEESHMGLRPRLPLDGGGSAPDAIRSAGGGARAALEDEASGGSSPNSAGLTPSVTLKRDSSPIEGERGRSTAKAE